MSLEALRSELRDHVEPGRAEVVAPYLGIRPGGYGEGDVCLGVRVPDVRRVARNHRDLSVDELAELLRGEIHEERLAALILLVRRYPKEPERVYDLYLASTAHIDNWDLVDGSAPHIVGAAPARAARVTSCTAPRRVRVGRRMPGDPLRPRAGGCGIR